VFVSWRGSGSPRSWQPVAPSSRSPASRQAPVDGAYWARKHGLSSQHAERHAARGGIDRELLALLIQTQLSIRDLAEALECSPATVRHWIQQHGLDTAPMARRRAARSAVLEGVHDPELPCPRHGTTRHVPRRDGSFRCVRCRSEQVANKRRRIKLVLIAEAGGSCILCGYSRCAAALQFHHLDPSTKRFSLSHDGVTRSLSQARAEASKCVLLCANCHAEVENGFAQLPLRSADDSVYPA
jgi:hypothetical protein